MNMNTRTAVPDGMLRPYDSNDNQMTFYAAASINVVDYQRRFTIGDNQSYTQGGVVFLNSPLRADQQYVFFVRLYSSQIVSMYNEEGRRKRKGERGVRREEERKEGREWREGGRGKDKERRRGWLRGRGRR